MEALLGGLAGNAPARAPASDNDLSSAKIVEALKQLKPTLENAIAQHPDRKTELLAAFTQIRDEVKGQQFSQAQANLGELEKLLKTLAEAPREASPSPSPVDDKLAIWKAKVAEWGPAIKAAIAAKGPNAAEMVKLLSQASALSKPGGNLDEAIAKLTECHELISQSSDADPAVLFNERLKALLPDIKKAAGTPTGEEAKLRASEAGMFARKKDFTQANQLLDRITQLLRASNPSAPSPATAGDKPASSTEPQITRGIVKYRMALLNYRSERQKVLAQLQELYNAISGALPDKAKMTEKLQERLEITLAEIDDAIDAAMSAAENEREPYNDKTRALMKAFAKS